MMPGRPVNKAGLGRFARRIASRLRREVHLRTAPPAPPPPPPPAPEPEREWHYGLTNEQFVDELYLRTFDRPADPAGRALYVDKLTEWTSTDLESVLGASPEAVQGPGPRLAMEAFHGGRISWTRSLPPARRILDLGGTALGDDRGALLALGYPYHFDELIIIELPPQARHELYQVPEMKAVETSQGPVHYRYQSMCQLDNFADDSFDLICSAQTFEHITEEEGKHVLSEVRRLLAPGGMLALDTPNRAVTEIEVRGTDREFINPDHKVEYTHPQMLELFAQAGLTVLRQHGIGYMPRTVETGSFVLEELIDHPGLYDDIERSYTLAYLAKATSE
jgi:SAM-dependent methyltransferase